MSNFDLKLILPDLHKEMGDIDFAIMQQFVEDMPVAKGEVIINSGDEMNFAFFIIKGTLGIHLGSGKSDGSESLELKSATTGKWIGQMFFLEPDKSSITATALEDGVVGRISEEAFNKMLSAYPATADMLLRSLSLELSNRMRRAGKLLFKRFSWDQVEGTEGEDGARQWFAKVYCEMNGFSG
ncbi:MAG: cyclic nucleotide-binding domain-containing protein [Rhodospirillaceae bacterium]|nr:cyclic nucleotide-binding domain-containing protein [Rhodospirillaceae bacterium]